MSGIVDAIFGGGDSSPPPAPDYTPLANASAESAQIMGALGEKQLAESTRQYELNSAIAKPVVDAQLGIMKQTAEQGQEYYDYAKDTFRPVEKSLVSDAQNFSTAGAKEKFAADAAATLEGSQANERAQSARAMAAMGINPNSARFAGVNRAQTVVNAGARAGASSSAAVQADNLAFAKRMDVSGLGRNLPGASVAAYGAATGSGNAAVGNQMAPGGQLLSGMAQGASITGQGQNMMLSGLGSALNSQTSIYDATLASNASEAAGRMAMVGAIAGGAMKFSDRRLKENIAIVGYNDTIQLPIYEFNYKSDPSKRYRGVMADDVEERIPTAVWHSDGYALVDYRMLGLEMVEV